MSIQVDGILKIVFISAYLFKRIATWLDYELGTYKLLFNY